MSVFKFFDETSVPNKSTSDETLNAFELTLQPNKNQRYEISYTNVFFAMGQQLANVQTTTKWILKVINSFEDGYVVDVEVEDQEVFNNNPAMNDVLAFARIFNYPTKMLVIKVNKSGKIERVLNQEEITERWNEIKEDALKPLENTEEDNQILEKGNIQFTDTLPSLKETLLYNLFFAPLYGKKYVDDKRLIDKGDYTSQLFQSQMLQYELREHIIATKNGQVNIRHVASFINTTQQQLEVNKFYTDLYKPLCGPDFNYAGGYTADYVVDIETGLINSCNAVFSEKANDGLYYQTDYVIKRI